jgi:actin-related protein 10
MGRALKTGAPEIIREEYDSRLSESLARGDHYRAALEEASAEAEVAAAVGIDVDKLQPGMALVGSGRRRGWRDGVVVGDWTRHGTVV